jgi:hypothetical protein
MDDYNNNHPHDSIANMSPTELSKYKKIYNFEWTEKRGSIRLTLYSIILLF